MKKRRENIILLPFNGIPATQKTPRGRKGERYEGGSSETEVGVQEERTVTVRNLLGLVHIGEQ